jgi:hypothetical protein
MILSHTHKFIFICSSKVGTTSMEHVLRPLQEGAEYDFGTGLYVPKHIPPAVLKGVLPSSIWEEYFKFVFVRNPWDWFVSQWYYNSRGALPDPPERPPPRAMHKRLRRAVRAAAAAYRRSRNPPPRPLYSPPTEGSALTARDVDVVFEVLKRFKGLPGRDGLYQSNWVYDMDDRQLVDYVGRYETMERDFAEIMRRLNLDLRLPHLNRTAHKDYRSYYTQDARLRVGELWALDIMNFGYSFDPPAPTAETSV